MPQTKEERIVTMESRSMWAEEVLTNIKDFTKEMNKSRKEMEKSRKAYIMRPDRADGDGIGHFDENSELLTDFIHSASKMVNLISAWLEKMVEKEGLNPNILDNES